MNILVLKLRVEFDFIQIHESSSKFKLGSRNCISFCCRDRQMNMATQLGWCTLYIVFIVLYGLGYAFFTLMHKYIIRPFHP